MSESECVGCSKWKSETKKLNETLRLLRLKTEDDLKTSNIYMVKRIQSLEEQVLKNQKTIEDMKKVIDDYEFFVQNRVESKNHEKQD